MSSGARDALEDIHLMTSINIDNREGFISVIILETST